MRTATPLTEPLKLIIQPDSPETRYILSNLGFCSVPQVSQLLYQVTLQHQLSEVFTQISQSLSDFSQTQSRYCITRSSLDSQALLLDFLDAQPLSTITVSVKHAWFLRVLAQQRLFFNYQPIFDLRHGHVIAYECLARACSDQNDACFTGQQLIDGAVSLSLTSEFDELALATCLQAIANTGSSDTFYVNLLPNAIASNPHFLEQTLQQVKDLGLHPQQIMFELTEVESLLHHHTLPKLIDEIQQLGFGIAVDDLYGNVAIDHYFMEFRPDVIKLDRLMVSGCGRHPLKQILVKNLVRSAHELGVPVLAEGLEDSLDIQFCRDEGVDYGQGFGLARPKAVLQLASLNWKEVLSAM
ncbi:MAG: EAL domain-containing protein [Oscillatoriales cyanobacterium C42_A2020_001]|nr:EAL domain-containing protein [Leptolyngbyaceae cyanobacterium C42_A2020_001]